MTKLLKTAVSFAAAAGLAACVSVEENPPTAELPPAQQPEWEVGYTLVQKNAGTGAERSWTIEEIKDGVVRAKATDGCEWANTTDWFSPALEWKGCGGASGSREITGTDGTLWPLQVGKTMTYTYANSDGSSGERNCEVEAAVNIMVVERPTDAYKVVCRDGRTTSTWYWSPDKGEVKYIRERAGSGIVANVDQLRVEKRPAS